MGRKDWDSNSWSWKDPSVLGVELEADLGGLGATCRVLPEDRVRLTCHLCHRLAAVIV